MFTPPPNELRVDLLSSAGINPWAQHDSSSRVQMIGGHLSQALVVEGATPRRCMTGIEREFGKYTFKVKFPVDAEIIKVIQKYPTTLARDSIRENPMYIVIYMNTHTKEVCILEVPRFHCLHQHFGFRYKFKPASNRLIPGATFAAETVLADSPAVDNLGNYSMGVESNLALMSLPGIIEDGVIVSEDYVQKLKSKGYESRAAMWGSRWYPLNLYGTDTEYKPFPDIGDTIREDGLLFALRRYDDMLAPVEMTLSALREPDYIFDRLTYAKPGARVVDVHVRHEIKNGPPPTPVGMEVQTEKYYRAQMNYYDALLTVYKDLKKKYGENLRISPAFHALLTEGLIYRGEGNKSKATHIYQRQPLDDWRVEVTFEYDVIPTVGYKLTNLHGGKGVICDVWKTEDMPVDKHGTRADIIMDGDSILKRLNPGVLYEQYINATSFAVSGQVREFMDNPTPANVDKAWKLVLGYYQIVSPRFHALITGPSYKEAPRAHLEAIKKDGIYLWLPPDNPEYSPTIIKRLNEQYKLDIGPVTFRGRSGNVVTTISPVLIGTTYFILLEKTGDDWSGVSSSRLQHFGLPARLTKNDKHSLPGRAQPVRIFGESEVRLGAATIGGDAMAELLEMSNSPATHRHAVSAILRSEKPSAIKELIDRSVAPRGGSRSLTYVNHALQCSGIEFFEIDANNAAPRIYEPLPDHFKESLEDRMQRIPMDDDEPEDIEPITGTDEESDD